MFLKISQILQKTPVLESLFYKVAVFQACNFVKNRLQHRCFPVKERLFYRTPPAAASENIMKVSYFDLWKHKKLRRSLMFSGDGGGGGRGRGWGVKKEVFMKLIFFICLISCKKWTNQLLSGYVVKSKKGYSFIERRLYKNFICKNILSLGGSFI